MSLLGLLVMLIVCGVVIWATQKLLAAFGIGEPISTVIYVLVVIVILAYVLQFFGLGPSWGTLRFR